MYILLVSSEKSQFLQFKRLAALALLLFCSLLCTTVSLSATRTEQPNYVVRTEPYRENYILTQLFYSAFSVDDLAPIQQLVKQGLSDYPNDFPRFMSLCLEMLKKPDSRLFMLLSPLAPYMADQSHPADLESVIHLTNILSGKVLPGGGAPSQPSLISRIKFYEDNTRVVQREQPEQKEALPAPPVPGENRHDPPATSPAYVADKDESLVFTRNPAQTDGVPLSQLSWVRPGASSRALDSILPDGSLWGGVYTNINRQREEELSFFMVRDGIISFALPKNISEGDFYADEKARPHHTKDFDQSRLNGTNPRPCEMQIVIRPWDDAMPPELSVSLEQTNAGLDASDFICRPQCSLSYSWAENGYELSGKSCVQSGWGVWPHSDASYPRREPRP